MSPRALGAGMATGRQDQGEGIGVCRSGGASASWFRKIIWRIAPLNTQQLHAKMSTRCHAIAFLLLFFAPTTASIANGFLLLC